MADLPMKPASPVPWRAAPEEHLGSPAWSIFDAAGDRLSVGWLRADAEAVVAAMNAKWASAQ